MCHHQNKSCKTYEPYHHASKIPGFGSLHLQAQHETRDLNKNTENKRQSLFGKQSSLFHLEFKRRREEKRREEKRREEKRREEKRREEKRREERERERERERRERERERENHHKKEEKCAVDSFQNSKKKLKCTKV